MLEIRLNTMKGSPEHKLLESWHPPLIVYNEDKRIYYECLQKYDEDEGLHTLYEFLKYETEKTWEKALTHYP